MAAAIVALLLALGVQWFVNSAEVALLDKQVSKLQNEAVQTKLALNTAVSTNKTLTASVDSQNKQIDGWVKDAIAAQRASDEAKAKYRKDLAVWQQKYNGLLGSGPVEGEDQCAALERRYTAYLKLREESQP